MDADDRTTQGQSPERPEPGDALIALALGELSDADRALAESTLSASDRITVERLRTTVTTIADPAMQVAPAGLMRRLEALGRVTAVGEAVVQVAGVIRRLAATLTFDSRVRPALAGFRGVAEGRQLVFSSEAGEVHLRFTGPSESDPRITIWGSVESEDGAPAAGSVRLGEGDAALEADVDDDGMFVLRSPAGSYPLVVRVGGVEIDLGLLDVA